MNNSLSQKYVQEVKMLFPILRKEEKDYLKKMKQNLDDYCENIPIQSIEDLYNEFGKPQDVVYDYFSITDIASLISSIHIQKIMRRVICFACAVALIGVSFYCILLYQEHTSFMRQEAVFIEETISDPLEEIP